MVALPAAEKDAAGGLVRTTVSGRNSEYTMTGRMIFDTETGRSRVVLDDAQPGLEWLGKMQGVFERHCHVRPVGPTRVAARRGGMDGSATSQSFGLETAPATATRWGTRNCSKPRDRRSAEAREGERTRRTDDALPGRDQHREQAEQLRKRCETFPPMLKRKGTPLRVEAWIDARWTGSAGIEISRRKGPTTGYARAFLGLRRGSPK